MSGTFYVSSNATTDTTTIMEIGFIDMILWVTIGFEFISIIGLINSTYCDWIAIGNVV